MSEPLKSDTVAIGGGAVHLWVKSSTPDVDLQATVSEVRPDGNETFVQDGYLRASERKLATNANNLLKEQPTELEPIPTMLPKNVRPMPAGQVRAGGRPAVLRGPRLPDGLADQGHDRSAQRNPADLVVQQDTAGRRNRDGVDRLLAQQAVEPDPADRAGCERADANCPPARACATSPVAPTRRT